jgi:hypothetical protein
MTIGDLIQQLEEARDDLGGDPEVRIAYQPNWPLRAAVAYVTIPPCSDPGDLYGEGEAAPGQDKDGRFCWIAASDAAPWDENPYAPRWAWQQGEADRS